MVTRLQAVAAAAIGIVVVAALVLAMVWLGDDAPDPVAAPITTGVPDGVPEPAHVIDGQPSEICRQALGGELQPESVPDGGLATGASRAWLCGEPTPPYGGRLGPLEPLTSRADEVVALINELPKLPDDIACTEMYQLIYHVVVEYPGEPPVVVAADVTNCTMVGGWDGGRSGGDQLLVDLQELWDQDRAARDLPIVEDADLCQRFPRSSEDETWPHGPDTIMPLEMSDLARGQACGLAVDAVDFDGEVRSIPLPEDVVTSLRDAPWTGETDLGWDPVLQEKGLPYFVMSNAHGDPVTVRWWRDGRLTTSGGELWVPDDVTAARLLGVLEPVRTEPFVELPGLCTFSEEQVSDLAEVTRGAVCPDPYAVPDEGPELDPTFAALLATRFETESETVEILGFWGSSRLVLATDTGEQAWFDVSHQPDGYLVAADGSAAWRVPDDIRAELELHGLGFSG